MRIISGSFKNHTLISPKGDNTRPTSGALREAVFNICQSCIEGSNFLDVFAGSGAMGLEAISRGANFSAFIDNNKEAIQAIKSNIEKLKIHNKAKIFPFNVIKALEKIKESNLTFDIIYIDPPYFIKGKELPPFSFQVLTLIDELNLLKPNGILFLEESIYAEFDENSFKHLKFKDKRKMGNSVLRRFFS